jgi:hypothetical protein
MSTRALIAGIAALFLATGTAHAQFFGPPMNQGAVTNPYGGIHYGNRATPHQTDPRSVLKRCGRAGVLRECEVYLKRQGRR